MTSRSRACRAAAACGIAVAIALGGAHSAIAIATSTQVASSTYAGGGNLYLFSGVSCPPGEIAIGGGVGVSNPYFLGARSSGPTYDGVTFYNGPDGLRGAPNGWRGQAITSAASMTLKVGAVCAPAADVQTSVASTSIPPGEIGTAAAECPSGTVALSGGIQAGAVDVTILDFQPTYASGSLATFPLGEAPAPDGWTTTVRNDDIFERFLKVAAICIAETDAIVTTQVTNFALYGNDVGGGGLACPDGAIATGGAFAAPDGASLSLIANAPRIGSNDLATVLDGENPPPDAWHGTSRNLGSSLVFAPLGVVCVPEPGSALLTAAAFATLLSLRRPGQAAQSRRELFGRSRRKGTFSPLESH